MRFTPLFEADYTYTTSIDVVEEEEQADMRMQLMGGGDGRFRGRLSGVVHWDNAPFMRADGIITPNVRGYVTTPEGARVRFEGQGYSLPPDPGKPQIRRFIKHLRFYTKHEAYTWLNSIIAVEEGVIETHTGRCYTRCFEAVHELYGVPEEALTADE